MAAIFKVKKKTGEVHVYHNRVPKKNGKEPLLFWVGVAGLFFVVRCIPFMVLLVFSLLVDGGIIAVFNIISDALHAVLFDVLVLVFLGSYVCMQFSKLVFSPRQKQIYSGFLFFRKKLARFDEIGSIELSRQEVKGKALCWYVATWHKDKIKTPLRLSPRTKSLDQLSRYYYTIVPLLQSMLPVREAAPAENAVSEAEDVDEVGVETVEVPVDEADEYLAAGNAGPGAAKRIHAAGRHSRTARVEGEPTGMRRKDTRARQTKGKKIFTRDKGVYTTTQISTIALAVVGLIAVMLGLGYFFTLVFPSNHWIIAYGTQFIILLGGLRQVAKSSVRLSINPRRKSIFFTTGFGLAKHEYSFETLQKFTIKNEFGSRSLCMVLDGQAVDPVVVQSRSDVRIRSALEEVCGIMGLDPDEWLSE